MKVKEATVNVQDVFDNFKVNFLQADGCSIHYFVGNNGAGKTKLLEALHTTISSEIMRRTSSENVKIEYSCKRGEGIESKSIYTNIFHNQEEVLCSSVTASTVDDMGKNYDDIKNKLHYHIPQILINLQQHDAVLRSRWIDKNIGKKLEIPQKFEGEKFHRFTEAYNEIFEGEKEFGEIIYGHKNGKDIFNIKFIDKTGAYVDLNDLSTGEKQVIYRLGFILSSLGVLENGYIFIDEPELGLHPIWQQRFKLFLFKIFKDMNVQIFIATHSPYIFGELNSDNEECLLIDRTTSSAERINFPSINNSKKPSMNLITYLAYKVPSNELHIELYNEIQAMCGKDIGKEPCIRDIEVWLESKGIKKEKRSESGKSKFLNNDGSCSGRSSEETLFTWIRNKMHHPECEDREFFTEEDLSKSIKEMIGFIN